MVQVERRAKGATKRRRKHRSRLRRNRCSAIILLDSGPIRRKRIGAYRRLKRRLEKARAEQERYEREDMPAFRSWFHFQFGERLSRIRDLEAEYEDKDSLVDQVREEVMWRGGPYYAAYRRVQERRERWANGEEDEPFDGPNPDFGMDDEFESSAESSDGDVDFESFESIARQLFEEAFGGEFSSDDDETGAPQNFGPFMGLGEKRAPQAEGARLKGLYRRLARRLHPDNGSGGDGDRSELWHELQEAYDRQDLDAMIRLEAKCDLHSGTVSDNIPVSRIDELIEESRDMLRAVRTFLRASKNEPAWGFAGSNGHRESLAQEIERDLIARESWLCGALKELNVILKRWVRVPRRKRGRKMTRIQPSQDSSPDIEKPVAFAQSTRTPDQLEFEIPF